MNNNQIYCEEYWFATYNEMIEEEFDNYGI